MRNFKFLWRRLDKPNWHGRVISASTPEEAITVLERALAARADFPDNVVVDHPFHEMTGEVATAHFSMRNFSNPFPVMFANEVLPIGHYTAATAS